MFNCVFIDALSGFYSTNFFFSRIKMENVKLRRLAVFIENEEREDVVIIFAQPCIKVK